MLDYWIGELERSREFLPDMMKNLQTEMETIASNGRKRRIVCTKRNLEVKDLEIKIAEE